MKLRFYAREDLLVRDSRAAPQVGQPARYFGRTFDAEKRGYPAISEAFEVDSDTEAGAKCAKQCRKRALWAADAKTAAAVNAPLVQVAFVAGAWVQKSAIDGTGGGSFEPSEPIVLSETGVNVDAERKPTKRPATSKGAEA